MFNHRHLDRLAPGYSTINVEGRQMFSPSNNYDTVRGRHGDILIDSAYPAREIIVHYMMEAESNAVFLRRMKQLTMYLQSDADVEFSFSDEPGVRFGRISDFEDPPYDANIGMGSFTIHCSDPFLYSAIKESANEIKTFKLDYYPVRVESMEMQLRTSGSKLVLKNDTRGRKIVVNTSFSPGDIVRFEGGNIYKNKGSILKYLDYVESDYFNFDLYSRDRFFCNLAGDVKVRYRERVL